MGFDNNCGSRDDFRGTFRGNFTDDFRDNRRDRDDRRDDRHDRDDRRDRGDFLDFLKSLSPGVQVVLQYDDQKPAKGTFQGFDDGNVLLTDFNDFPGLVRIRPKSINAIAPFHNGKHRECDRD